MKFCELYFQKVQFINSNFWDGGLNSIVYHSSKISLTLPSRDAICLFIFLIQKNAILWEIFIEFRFWLLVVVMGLGRSRLHNQSYQLNSQTLVNFNFSQLSTVSWFFLIYHLKQQ